jgi:hypothetical protein
LIEAEKFDRIIVEGDAKIYYDILNGASLAVNWCISSVINNTSRRPARCAEYIIILLYEFDL